MRTIRIIIFCLSVSFLSYAQQDKNTKAIPKSNRVLNYDSIVYANARANGDYVIAINALYYMMAKNPQKSIAYKDSLATIYYLTKLYQKCVVTGSEVLASQPDNLRIMELVAISERIIGQTKNSLNLYENLYSKTASLTHAYYVAEMQFNLQRYGECMNTIEKIIASEKSEKETIQVAITADKLQTVFLKAAALNIKGMVYKQMGKSEEAKEAFQNALLIEKEFALPTANLQNFVNTK
ncbi:MAG: hypothetical protein H0W84_09730 [Bacteroidetes bacterium]|nr:hypothetical protein [Bacteroidota bacterium]